MKMTSAKYSPAVEVFLLSLACLFFELLVIRLLSAEIRAFSVFKTFPLVACFVGIGLGLALRSRTLFRSLPLLFLAFIAILKHVEFLGSATLVFPSTSVWSWLVYDNNSIPFLARVASFSLIMLYTLTGPFLMSASIGSGVGLAMEKLSPVKGYCVNIAGSIVGSALFTALCFLGFPPEPLVVVPVLIQLFYLRNDLNLKHYGLLALAMSLLVWMPAPKDSEFGVSQGLNWQDQRTLWSPYQRIDWRTIPENEKSSSELGIRLNSNHNFYQECFKQPGPEARISKELSVILNNRKIHDGVPYRFCRPRSVLILGAGLGADVEAALQFGARDIDAVEIDPVILKLGAQRNPAYSDPCVHPILDDARHYIQKCRKHYDLIVFCLLDSQSVNGYGSSLRLDNYVYTKEGLERSWELLNNGGLMALSFVSSPEWTTRHILNTLTSVAGKEPLSFHALDRQSNLLAYYYFVVAKARELSIDNFRDTFVPTQPRFRSDRVLTDDWPYLYVNPAIFDFPLTIILGIFMSVALFVSRKIILRPAKSNHWQMFFLGAGFMMLELQAISRLSVLYGATWITSSIVINGCLVMILLASLLVLRYQSFFQNKILLVYVLHFFALLASWAIFDKILLSSSSGALAGTVIALLPVLTSALIFAPSFARIDSPAVGLGFNLFGSVAGAILEFLANYLGIRNMLLIGAALYLLSLVCFLKQRNDTPSSATCNDQ